MKKIIIVLGIILNLLVGCGMDSQDKQSTFTLSEKDSRGIITKLTNQEIYKILVKDFSKNGKKEAFVLTRDKQGEESQFKLWYLNSKGQEKLIDTCLADNNTSIEVFNANKSYVIYKVSQVRPNDYMKTTVYCVNDDKPVELFSQKRLNLYIEKKELYAYGYSYSEFDPEVKHWMSFSEQKYHFKFDEKTEKISEYSAKKITDKQFKELKKADELLEVINKKINIRYSKEFEKVDYSYLMRADETIDINIIISCKDGSKHRHYVTVPYKNNVVETNVEILDGIKENSLLDSINDIKS